MRKGDDVYSRREMIAGAGIAAGATLALGQSAWAAQAKTDTADESQLSIPEQLMRQHAIADRLLLVYQTAVTPATGAAQPPMKVLATTAQMIRSNVDDFHVRLEEEQIFPLFQKSSKMTDLVNTLREQHATGRRLTDSILKATSVSAASANTGTLTNDLRAYIHMIQAHTAFEETLLYPQIRTVASAGDLDKVHKAILDAGRQRPASESFSGLLAKIADLDNAAGITGLAQFTPVAGRETAMGTPGTPTR